MITAGVTSMPRQFDKHLALLADRQIECRSSAALRNTGQLQTLVMTSPAHEKRTKNSLANKARWALFRTLETFSHLRNPPPPPQLWPGAPPRCQSAIWVFVSTIGELNAIAPLIEGLMAVEPGRKVVLLSDHHHYCEAYLSKYPEAAFFYTLGASKDAETLCRHYPPRLLVIGEIPCIPSDAPCRFSYAFIRAAKRRGARVAIVNGWLYGQRPGCRLDEWESRLFTRLILQQVDLACLQTQEIADRLARFGLDERKVEVTGNMKFDSLKESRWLPEQARSPVLLTELSKSTRDIVVVGCLRNMPEQATTIEAFRLVKQQRPNVLGVIVHRHPEVEENLILIERDLVRAELSHARRTEIGDSPIPNALDCLIVDTMGELRDFYAVATVAHVGADHNLLEPLAFGKPVTAVGAWTTRFPNFPIFELLRSSGGIIIADNAQALAQTWIRWLESPDERSQQVLAISSALDDASGATAQTLERLNALGD